MSKEKKAEVEQIQSLDTFERQMLRLERDMRYLTSALQKTSQDFSASWPRLELTQSASASSSQKDQIRQRLTFLNDLLEFEQRLLDSPESSLGSMLPNRQSMKTFLVQDLCHLKALFSKWDSLATGPEVLPQAQALGFLLQYDFSTLYRGRVANAEDRGASVEFLTSSLIPLAPPEVSWQGMYFEILLKDYERQEVSLECPGSMACLPMRYANTPLDAILRDILQFEDNLERDIQAFQRELSLSESKVPRFQFNLAFDQALIRRLAERNASAEIIRAQLNYLSARLAAFRSYIPSALEQTEHDWWELRPDSSTSFRQDILANWEPRVAKTSEALKRLKDVLVSDPALEGMLTQQAQILWLDMRLDSVSETFVLRGRVTHPSLMGKQLPVRLNDIVSNQAPQIEWQGLMFTVRIPEAREVAATATVRLCRAGKCQLLRPEPIEIFEFEVTSSIE